VLLFTTTLSPRQIPKVSTIVVTLNIVKSNVTILSQPFDPAYKLVYIPVESYVTPSQIKLLHELIETVFVILIIIERSKVTVLSQP